MHALFVCIASFFLRTALNDIRVDMFRKFKDDLMRNGLEQFWSLFISGVM